MQPIVVTRFAIRWKGKLPSEEWVRERAEMRAAMPSPPVPWVWRTAPEHRPLVRSIARTFKPRPFVVLDDAKTVDISGDEFLTFRLDSDDVWFPHVFRPYDVKPGDVVSFNRGYQLEWHERRAAERRYPSGPFLAVANTRDRMLSVGGNHGTVRHGRRVVQVEQPSWVQVIHGGNLMNGWKNGDEVPLEVIEEAGRWRL